jgi:hypothetical protein
MADAQKSTLQDYPTFAGAQMKEIHPINKDSDFWKSINKANELDPEKAAAQAAERARKEVLDKIAERDAVRKAFLDSLRYIEKLEFKTQVLRDQIKECEIHRAELSRQSGAAWAKEERLIKEIQNVCTHDLCIEIRTSYRDEYDSWHDGHYERKCIECFLVEESDGYGCKKYNKLEKSQVILLRKVVEDKEFQLEFDDLKWSALP